MEGRAGTGAVLRCPPITPSVPWPVGLSRSTLLYYDRIGLLKADSRSEAHYRRYTRAEADRLERIGRYRQAGLSLATIRRVLDAPEPGLPDALAARLMALNEEGLTPSPPWRKLSALPPHA